MGSVATELKRARREPEAEAFVKAAIDEAGTLEAATSALSLAAERGDVDVLLGVIERYDRLAAASAQAPASANNIAVPLAIARTMGARAEAKDLPGVLRLLDFQFASTARPDQVARRLKARNAGAATQARNYAIYTGKTQTTRYSPADFPSPNLFFDSGLALRAPERLRGLQEGRPRQRPDRPLPRPGRPGRRRRPIDPDPGDQLPALVERRQGRGAQGIHPGRRPVPGGRRAQAQPGRAVCPARRAGPGPGGGRLGRAARPEDDAATRGPGAPPGRARRRRRARPQGLRAPLRPPARRRHPGPARLADESARDARPVRGRARPGPPPLRRQQRRAGLLDAPVPAAGQGRRRRPGRQPGPPPDQRRPPGPARRDHRGRSVEVRRPSRCSPGRASSRS